MGLRPMAPWFFEADENRKADFASASQPTSASASAFSCTEMKPLIT